MMESKHMLPPNTRRRHAVRGITLVELMVSITVGLILLAGIIQLFVSNKQAYRIQEGATVLNENSRYAFNQLNYSLRMAGHWGGTQQDSVTVTAPALADDCTESPVIAKAADAAKAGFGIEGFDGADDTPLDCIADADYHPNTDILILRYAGSDRRNDVYVQAHDNLQFVRAKAGYGATILDGASFEDVVDEPADTEGRDLVVPDPGPYDEQVANYDFNFVAYFIRNCASQEAGDSTVCDAGDDQVPTLARLILRDGALIQEDVIAGVEQLQVIYGVDDNNDRSPNRYLSATDINDGIAGANWDKVIDARVSLVLRNSERDVTFADTKTYQLYGGDDGAGLEYTPVAADEQFRRKQFSASVQSRNNTRNKR